DFITRANDSLLIEEMIPGSDLTHWSDQMRRSGGRVSELVANMRGVLIRLGDQLGRLHDLGYVVQDLCPDNVVVGPHGVRIVDAEGVSCIGESRPLFY